MDFYQMITNLNTSIKFNLKEKICHMSFGWKCCSSSETWLRMFLISVRLLYSIILLPKKSCNTKDNLIFRYCYLYPRTAGKMKYKGVQINLTQLSKEVTTSQRKGYLILMLYQSKPLTSVKPSSNGGLVLPLDGRRRGRF